MTKSMTVASLNSCLNKILLYWIGNCDRSTAIKLLDSKSILLSQDIKFANVVLYVTRLAYKIRCNLVTLECARKASITLKPLQKVDTIEFQIYAVNTKYSSLKRYCI